MTKRKTKQITAQSVGGKERKYTFYLLDAEVGGRVFHEFLSLLLLSAPRIKDIVRSLIEGNGLEQFEGDTIFEMAPLFAQLMTWSRVQSLAKDMLVGAEIDCESTVETLDDKGFCDLFKEDPLEIYLALFWALAANFPKYIDPLLEALSDGDSNQDE